MQNANTILTIIINKDYGSTLPPLKYKVFQLVHSFVVSQINFTQITAF